MALDIFNILIKEIERTGITIYIIRKQRSDQGTKYTSRRNLMLFGVQFKYNKIMIFYIISSVLDCVRSGVSRSS